MPLPADQALYGAAYQVLHERLDPDSCVNHERDTVRAAVTENLRRWINEQEPHIAAAYRRALVDITRRAATVLENNERAAQMREARATLPVPPTE